ncbi:hypothetical protein AB0I84_09180 [Streptomyces spectabilis]|uniref:hypothetical protein n=1 Tax=Streptomyces spectabilis TaxID=68270 RepID=UPI0033FA6085
MLPESIPTVTVRGRFLSPDGRPLSGSVTFRAPAQITFPDADVILGGPVVAQLDAQGQISATLPATDAPDMDPAGWSYTVAEQLVGIPTGRSYNVLLPAEQPLVDLADIAPTDPSKPNYIPVVGPEGPRGPAGASAYEVAVAGGFTGTPAVWLASLVGPRGATGSTGAQGIQGVPGKDGKDGAPGAAGAPGLVQSVNGKSAVSITLTAGDVGALATTTAGAANGVATLGTDGKVPAAQLPTSTNAVASVNGKTGTVVLGASDVNAVATSAAGAAGGVATLDTSGKVPTAQLPAASGGAVASVNGQTGAVVLAAADVGAAAASHTHTAAQVGALATTTRGTANGVAPLDAASDVPLANLPDLAIPASFAPADLGLKAWAFDPVTALSTTAFTGNASLRFTAVVLRQTTSVSKIVFQLGGYAGTMNAGSWAAIYDSAGARKGATADMAGEAVIPGVHNAGGAAVTAALTSTASLAAGLYYIAYVFRYSASDGPMLLQLENGAGAPPNVFGPSNVKRFGVYTATVPTSPPASINLANIDNGANRFWAGLA